MNVMAEKDCPAAKPHGVPVAVKTASNAPVYLASRSLIRNFKPSVRSPRSMSVFRACCTVQAAVGQAVTPAR